MDFKKNGGLARIFIALGVFIYVGYQSRQLLPVGDLVVMIAFFTVYLLWSTVFEALIHQEPEEYIIQEGDHKSYLYLQLTFMLALFFATIDFIGLHYTRIQFGEPYIIYLGFALFIASCLIRWWGFKSIGKYSSPRVAIYRRHKLIVTGAYQNIRHPLYLGSLLSYLAVPLVFSSWGALVIIILTTIPALVYRIKAEEELLLSHFGEAYLTYSRATKKIIPGIW